MAAQFLNFLFFLFEFLITLIGNHAIFIGAVVILIRIFHILLILGNGSR